MLAVLVVETNRANGSDYIYLRKYLKSVYDSSNDVLSPVFLEGKGNYNKPARVKEIRKKISENIVALKEMISVWQ